MVKTKCLSLLENLERLVGERIRKEGGWNRVPVARSLRDEHKDTKFKKRY